MKTLYNNVIIIALILHIIAPAINADDYSQNFADWTENLVGDYTKDGWITTNVKIRASTLGFPVANSLPNSCGLFTEPLASIYTPYLTNTAGSISFYHQSASTVGPGTYPQVGVVESSLLFSGPWTETSRFTNSATTTTWDYESFPLNNFSNTYIRIRKLDDNGGAVQYLCIDDISISTIPDTGYMNISNSPASPDVNVDTTVYLSVVPIDGTVNNLSVTLNYSADNGSSYTPLTMTPSDITNFSRLIPGQPTPIVIRYYFAINFDIGSQTAPTDYHPSGAPASTLSYSHSPIYDGYRLEDFDDWSLHMAVGDYSNQYWNVYDCIVRGAGLGGFPGLSEPYSGWLADITSGNDPYIQSPLLAEVGTIYLAHRTKSTLQPPQVFTIETSPNASAPWTTNACFTNTTEDAAWHTNFSRIDKENVFVRIHKIDDGDVLAQALAIDDIFISYPPADVIITNVARTLGYMYTTNEVTVTCEVFTASSTIPAGNLQLKICHRSNPENPWITNDMVHGIGPAYSGTIPALGVAGQVDYFIRCDFDGYYYTNSFNNENQSPAFWPDTPETEHSATSWTNYTVRPFLSDFDYLSVTSTAGNVIMTLDKDYTWQGKIDMTINTQANLTFGILGFGYCTNSAPAYSLLTNHWGDTSHSNNAIIPDNGVAEAFTTPMPIQIGGPFASPVIISLDTRSLDYFMVRGFYQDFNSWVSANPDYYERTAYGIGNSTVTNDYNDWTISTNFVTTELSDQSAYFNNWTNGPLVYAEEDFSTVYWYTRQALLLPQRGTGSSNNNALILRPTDSGYANLRPSADTLNQVDGIGHINFNYRVSQFDDFFAVCNNTNSAQDWKHVRVDVNVTVNEYENDAAFSIMPLYDDSSSTKYMKARFTHELGTTKNNNLEVQWKKNNEVGTTHIGAQNLDNGSLDRYSTYSAVISPNNGTHARLKTLADNGYKEEWDYTTMDVSGGNAIALHAENCDISINSVKISPYVHQFWTDEPPNAASDAETNNWFWLDADNTDEWRKMTGTNAYIRTPNLGFDPTWMKLAVDQVSLDSGYDIWITGSPDNSTWINITNLQSTTNARITHIVTNIAAGYRYIRIEQNKTNTITAIDNVEIFGDTLYETDFSTLASTNNWTLDTGGGWNLDTNNNALNRPGYAGPPVRIVVETIPLKADFDIIQDVPSNWTPIYTNSVTNFTWATTNINLDTLDPFVEHAHPISFRIRNDNISTGPDSTGYLIIDNVDFSDWHGETIGDNTTWKATEARVETNGSDDVYIELARDRAYKDVPYWGSNYLQYVQSPPFAGGIASVGFKYKVTNAPVSFGVFISDTNNMSDPIWDLVPNSSFTVTNDSTIWLDKIVSIRETGPWAVRIAHTSTAHKATLMITDIMVTDYEGEVDSTWIGNNTLITGNENTREYSNADGARTCYLNKDGSSQVTGGTMDPNPTVAYLESPRSESGIGTISFWYRNFDESGSPAGAIELYATTTRSTDINTWGPPIATMTNITNTTYQLFSQGFDKPDARFLKIVNGINDIVTNGRVCIDNVMIIEPMGAKLVFANIKTIPDVPLYNTPVGIEVEVTKNIFSASNLTMRAYYKTGTNNWGGWKIGTASGSFLMTNASGPSEILGLYRTTNSFAPQDIDDVVQYYIVCDYEGLFNTSPQDYKGFENPSWYAPIDLNAADPASTIPYYFTFSCTTGAVWINEYNILHNTSPFNTNQFIELCGQANADISNWEIDILSGFDVLKDTYTINPNTYLDMNPTNGFGFWLIGDNAIFGKKQSLTNQIMANDKLRLIRSMGAYADLVVDQGLDDNWYSNASIALTNSGSSSSDFTWDWSRWYWSPGSNNVGQTLVNIFGPNLFVKIEIIDTWIEGNQTWIVYDTTGANFYLPPVPMYTTNISDTGSWQNVSSNSYGNQYPHPTEQNTFTSWWTTISADAVYHKLSVTNVITP